MEAERAYLAEKLGDFVLNAESKDIVAEWAAFGRIAGENAASEKIIK